MAKRYSIQAVIQAVDRFSGPFRKVLRTTQGAMGGVGARVGAISRQAQTMGQNMHTALIPLTALGAGAPLAVKSFAGFEAEMAKIRGLVGVSAEELAGWQDQIAAIGSKYGKSPQVLGDSLFYVTSAGLRGKVAMDVLESSAKASAAGLGEQSVIVDLLTSAVNAYGPASLSAASAADSLTEAIRLGKLEPASLAAAMGRTLPIASTLGVKFSEVSGMFAAMSRTGTKAEEAATQVRQIMISMLKPSVQATKALEGVGVSFDEVRKAVKERGLFTTLMALRKVMGGTNQDLVKIFPNVRALSGVFDLLGSNFEDNKTILGEMVDSTGVLNEAYQVVIDTLSQNFAQVLAQFKFTLIDIGSRLAPFAHMLIGVAKGIFGAYQSLPGPARTFVAAMVGVVSVVSAVAVAATGAILVLGALAPVFTVGTGALAGMGVALTGVTTLLGAVTSKGLVFTALLSKLAPMFGGLALVSSAWLLPLILGLGVAAGAVYYFWEPISSFFSGLWGGVEETNKESVDAMMEASGFGATEIGRRFTKVWESLKTTVRLVGADIVASVSSWFDPLLDTLVKFNQATLRVFTGLNEKIQTYVVTWVADIAASVSSWFDPLLDTLVKFNQATLRVFTGLNEKIQTYVVTWVADIAASVSSWFDPLLDTLVKFNQATLRVWESLKTTVHLVGVDIAASVSSWFDPLLDTLAQFDQATLRVWESLKTTVHLVGVDIAASVSSWFDPLLNTLAQFDQATLRVFTGLNEKIQTYVVTWVADIAASVSSWFDPLLDTLVKFNQATLRVWESLKTTVHLVGVDIAASVSSWFDPLLNTLAQFDQATLQVFTGLNEKIQTIAASMSSWFEPLLNTLVQFDQATLQVFAGLNEKIQTYVVTWVADIAASVSSWF